MFFERDLGIIIHSKEIYPDSLEKILYRFGNEADREKASDEIKSLTQLPIGSVLLRSLGESFKLEVAPSECPHYKLVLAGSLLTGKTNPSDIERLNQILCGNIMKEENTFGEFGPLSGRRGTDFNPLSQCWKTTIELAHLVKFMKQKEEAPSISKTIDNEEKLREVLNKREKINNNNERRQMVFSVWNDVRPIISKWLDEKIGNKMLPELKEQVKLDEKALLILKPKVFDASIQLNVGGPEYQEITNWVKTIVLSPLKTLVGEKNLSLYLNPKNMYLFAEDTAENCSTKPRGGFIGEMS